MTRACACTPELVKLLVVFVVWASIVACGPQAIAATKNLLSHARLTPPAPAVTNPMWRPYVTYW